MVNFEWRVYQENIVILGIMGSGKSTLGTEILNQTRGVPRVIVSPINRETWRAYGAPVDDLKALQGRGAYLWTGDNSIQTFEKICTIILDKIPNCIFIVDDVQEYARKMKIPDAFNTLIQSGRNRGFAVCI